MSGRFEPITIEVVTRGVPESILLSRRCDCGAMLQIGATGDGIMAEYPCNGCDRVYRIRATTDPA